MTDRELELDWQVRLAMWAYAHGHERYARLVRESVAHELGATHSLVVWLDDILANGLDPVNQEMLEDELFGSV